jgi:hypothetical protein
MAIHHYPSRVVLLFFVFNWGSISYSMLLISN